MALNDLLPYLVPGKDKTHLSGMNANFQGRLQEMLGHAPQGVQIYSGYRSPERQKQLYDAAVKKYGSPDAARKWVAPPGRSRHNHGTAADLKFASPEVKRWVHENAPKYGLNFRMGHEDWHIEPLPGWNGAKTVTANAGAAPAPVSQASAPRPAPSPLSNGEYLGQFRDDVPAMAKMMAPGAVAPFMQQQPPQMQQQPRPQAPPQAPQMTASVNPMQGAPGMPSARPSGLAGLFKPQGGGAGGASPMAGIAQALMGSMGGMSQQQQPMQPANFVVPAAEPGMHNPTPQGLADPRMAALLRMLQQQA